MKKEYIKPSVKTIRIRGAHSILAGSVTDKPDRTGGGTSKEEGDDIGW